MLRSLVSLLIAGGGVFLLFTGVVAPLTPPEGFPGLQEVLIYALAPLALLVVAISFAENGILRFLLVLVLIGAVAALGYVGLALFS